MSNEKFTSGEWHAKVHGIGGLNIGIVYINGGGFDVSGAPDCVANAHLIAAAPDMYQLLQHISISMECEHGVDCNEINELLAKARGE